METAKPDATCAVLAATGHEIVRARLHSAFGMGGAQLLLRTPGDSVADSDHLKDVCAAGY